MSCNQHDPIPGKAIQKAVRVLVLAGTYEARQLCLRLGSIENVQVCASLAGAVSQPSKYPVPVRIGGFGGPEGLSRELLATNTSILVDATHPYAAKISRNAHIASSRTGVPLIKLERPPWTCGTRDCWLEFSTLERAVRSLPSGSRVLAALGSRVLTGRAAKTLAGRPDIEIILRIIGEQREGRGISGLRVVACRPPFLLDEERDFLLREGITTIVCRNSGGKSGRLKLDAAAKLGIPVFMLTRPPAPEMLDGVKIVHDMESAFGRIKEMIPKSRSKN